MTDNAFVEIRTSLTAGHAAEAQCYPDTRPQSRGEEEA
jgi:hypothetical protein